MLKNNLIALLKLCWWIGRSSFWAGWWLFGLGLLAWASLRWWPGDRLWLVRLVNYFMPWLLVGLLPGLLIATFARRWWLTMVLAGPTLLIGLTFAPLFLPRVSTALAAGMPLKVLSYNVLYLNRDVSAITEVIRQEQPDIMLLQELKPGMVQALEAELGQLYPGGELSIAYERKLQQAVISHYPLTPIEVVPQAGRVQKLRIDTPGGPISVWNVHPASPFPWSRQYQQFSTLVADIAMADGPLIVGGDFNTTDQSETYQLVNQYLSNAHWEAGWGFGFSFPAKARRVRWPSLVPPVIRIDHIFYSDHFFARSARTLADSGGSDHRPVVAELSLMK